MDLLRIVRRREAGFEEFKLWVVVVGLDDLVGWMIYLKHSTEDSTASEIVPPRRLDLENSRDERGFQQANFRSSI